MGQTCPQIRMEARSGQRLKLKDAVTAPVLSSLPQREEPGPLSGPLGRCVCPFREEEGMRMLSGG